MPERYTERLAPVRVPPTLRKALDVRLKETQLVESDFLRALISLELGLIRRWPKSKRDR